MGVNSLWRTALLTASRHLRQNVLRGRIWGAGHVSDDDDHHAPSVAADRAAFSGYRKTGHGRDHARDPDGYRNGRVKGMVESFERGGSVSEGSTGHGRRRSGSASSQGSAWSADEVDGSVDGGGARDVSMQHDGGEAMTEPSVEDLLRAVPGPGQGSWGAKAWEEDVGIWETVKRVAGAEGGDRAEGDAGAVRERPLDGEDDSITDSDAELAAEFATSKSKKADVGMGSVRRNGAVGEGRTRGKKERRVVTAIFSGEVADVDGQGNEEVFSGAQVHHHDPPDSQEVVHLRSQVDETWTLLQSFKRRLEEVEHKIEHMDARERLLAQEREAAAAAAAAAARRAEEDQRESERRTAQERVEAEAAERTRMEDTRLSLALVLQPRVLFSRVLRLMFPSAPGSSPPPSSTRARSSSSRLERAVHPTTMSALPSYVLLVSIGVCAVVLRVVIRRLLGRRRAWDL